MNFGGLMRLIRASEADEARVAALYDKCRNRPGTHWRDEYPNMIEVARDVGQGALYMLLDGETLIGAATACGVDETEGLARWMAAEKPCEITRVCIAPERQGQGLSGVLIGLLLERAAREGFTAARLLVATDVPRAKKTYRTAGFSVIDTVFVPEWNNACYDCMERALP